MLSPVSARRFRARSRRLDRSAAAGMSLPQLMVGLAVGLLVTAAALGLVAVSGTENRRLLAEARLQQDLRAAMDIVTRELRRSGQWPDAVGGIWPSGPAPETPPGHDAPAVPTAVNPFGHFLGTPCNVATAAALSPMPPASAAHACHLTAAVADAVPARSGFHVSRGVLYAVLQGGTPQAVTDPAAFTVRRLTITSAGHDPTLESFCARPCGERCPRAALRAVVVELQAVLPDEPRTERRLRGAVRLRNDLLAGQCPAS